MYYTRLYLPSYNIYKSITNNTTDSKAIYNKSDSSTDELQKNSDNLPYAFCHYVNSTSNKLSQTKHKSRHISQKVTAQQNYFDTS